MFFALFLQNQKMQVVVLLSQYLMAIFRGQLRLIVEDGMTALGVAFYKTYLIG
jgi:hypothetical protein